jgi:Uma2 family endonuclease
VTAAPSSPDRREWTVDDLGKLPADRTYELLNGRLIVPSPAPAHQALGGLVWLAARAACPPRYFAGMGRSLKVNRRNEPRSDVVGIRIEHFARAPAPIEDAVLAIEIVSERSGFRDIVERAELYARAGIGAYWVIDPLREDISLTEMVLEPEHRRYAYGRHTTGVFTVSEPWPITIDLPALRKQCAALLRRAEESGQG